MATKHIVIVGASFGGRLLAAELRKQSKVDLKITLIDKTAHFEFICGSYKYLYDYGIVEHFEYLTYDMKKSMASLGEGVDFKHGKLLKVLNKENKIHIETKGNKNSVELEYDILVICTGGSYCSPWRDGEG